MPSVVLYGGGRECGRSRVAAIFLSGHRVPFDERSAEDVAAYQDALLGSGFEGEDIPVPVLTCGEKAWWGDAVLEGGTVDALKAMGCAAGSAPPFGATSSVFVFGPPGTDTATAALCRRLDREGILHDRRDSGKDKSFTDVMLARGLRSGDSFTPPVVTLGPLAWWGKGEDEIVEALLSHEVPATPPPPPPASVKPQTKGDDMTEEQKRLRPWEVGKLVEKGRSPVASPTGRSAATAASSGKKPAGTASPGRTSVPSSARPAAKPASPAPGRVAGPASPKPAAKPASPAPGRVAGPASPKPAGKTGYTGGGRR
eukprot:TRINITY_DN1545_c1_g2_i1.p1 TRINITY_DN1545_c1_g2~~TRINITY_DN1545_c1_g2_i1.p1  ORF type:complete len:334 (+),score=84.13 TRINITY_DN1545_c1_g2_i1:65-1003(+)